MSIIVDGDKCDGCRICEQVCTFFHEREFNPRRARIKVVRTEREYTAAPVVCNQCRDCIDVCAVQAVSWDEASGIIRIDSDKCDGCGTCVECCELGAISIDPVTQIAIVCDLCNGEPQCVLWCPEGAIRYEPQGVGVTGLK